MAKWDGIGTLGCTFIAAFFVASVARAEPPTDKRWSTHSNPDVLQDATTSLTWQRTVPTDKWPWETARSYCARRDPLDTWRLPTKPELESFIAQGLGGPPADRVSAADMGIADADVELWSATAGEAEKTAWKVTISRKDGGHFAKSTVVSASSVARVFCVNSQMLFLFSANGHFDGIFPANLLADLLADAPVGVWGVDSSAHSQGKDSPARWKVSGDTVYDNETKLTWQRTAPDGRGTGRFNWADAKAHCANLGGGWRLPSQEELASLVVLGHGRPTIDRDAFPDAQPDWYWSASPVQGKSNLAWNVNFNYGSSNSSGGDDVGDDGLVRCVRSGSSTEVDNAQAVEAYRRTCAGGDQTGCVHLAKALRGGVGIDKDRAKAQDLLETACSKGIAQGCDDLGSLVEPARAVTLYDRACAGGAFWGCIHGGVLLALGKQVPKDGLRAMRLLTAGCKLEASVCGTAGEYAEKGFAQAPDPAAALRFYLEGCARRHPPSCASVERLRKAGETTPTGAGLAAGGKTRDASAGASNPQRWTVNGDTVFDNQTKLTWQRTVPLQSFTAEAAKAHCTSLGGGWRLPSKSELESLLVSGAQKPTLDHVAFAQSGIDAGFWTVTPLDGTPSYSWYVDFAVNDSSACGNTNQYPARCVR